MRGGKLNDPEFGSRMRGGGIWAGQLKIHVRTRRTQGGNDREISFAVHGGVSTTRTAPIGIVVFGRRPVTNDKSQMTIADKITIHVGPGLAGSSHADQRLRQGHVSHGRSRAEDSVVHGRAAAGSFLLDHFTFRERCEAGAQVAGGGRIRVRSTMISRRRCGRARSIEPGGLDQRTADRGLCSSAQLGLAHSVEAWKDGKLSGGLYGVSLGRGVFRRKHVSPRPRCQQGCAGSSGRAAASARV